MTPYHDTELRREINAILDDLSERHEPWRPKWITHEVCAAHRKGLAPEIDDFGNPRPDHLDAHVAFWDFTGYTLTRKFVTECINARADPPPAEKETQQKLPIPGFGPREHLQDYYVVDAPDGDGAIAVPLLQLTVDQVRQKINLYESHCRKAAAHAFELKRFLDFLLHQQRLPLEEGQAV